jgi:hypothetical protein
MSALTPLDTSPQVLAAPVPYRVTFRLREGRNGDPAALDAAICAWLADQPGFAGPSPVADAVLWQSHASAWAAAEKLARAVRKAPGFSAVDPASLSLTHAGPSPATLGLILRVA